jgi:hypothetical protein
MVPPGAKRDSFPGDVLMSCDGYGTGSSWTQTCKIILLYITKIPEILKTLLVKQGRLG